MNGAQGLLCWQEVERRGGGGGDFELFHTLCNQVFLPTAKSLSVYFLIERRQGIIMLSLVRDARGNYDILDC